MQKQGHSVQETPTQQEELIGKGRFYVVYKNHDTVKKGGIVIFLCYSICFKISLEQLFPLDSKPYLTV